MLAFSPLFYKKFSNLKKKKADKTIVNVNPLKANLVLSH